jgi:hypothetical protein
VIPNLFGATLMNFTLDASKMAQVVSTLELDLFQSSGSIQKQIAISNQPYSVVPMAFLGMLYILGDRS